MNSAGFIADLKKLSIEQIYNKYVIGGDVWYFKSKFDKSWFEKYDEFKLFISQKLEVHYNDIALAGSAKLGFSINPEKKFKVFDDDSDIDIIIISQKYYYLFWNAYIKDSYSDIKTKNFSKICFCIFRRYISLEGFTIYNPTYSEWLKKTQDFEKDLQSEFEITHDVHYRIFESWDAAKDYYISSIKKVKEKVEEI